MNTTPRYLADFEGGKVLIYERGAKTFFPLMKFEDFRTFEWCPVGESVAIEAAHGGRVSPWSCAQVWTSQADMKSFHAAATARDITLRLMPEQSTWKTRKEAGLEKKSGENDLLAWDDALSKRPHLWDTFQNPKNLGDFLDPAIDPRKLEKHTRKSAGLAYRGDLKDDFREVSASKIPYKSTMPGQIAYEPECIGRAAGRLSSHTSSDSGIVNGIGTFYFKDGTKESLNLLDVMGLEQGAKGQWKDPGKQTQYVSCMMLLVKMDGTRHVNRRTGRPMGFRDIKQEGIVSTAFHMKPGFARPKFYHHGIKGITKSMLTERFGVVPQEDGEGESKQPNVNWTNHEDAEFVRWIRNTCRIAYEQTTKAMIAYLNDRGLNTEPPTQECELFEEENELVLA
jgi:hypothetical protein